MIGNTALLYGFSLSSLNITKIVSGKMGMVYHSLESTKKGPG
jgi:hypothetical protein